jgi:hypothetical protein
MIRPDIYLIVSRVFGLSALGKLREQEPPTTPADIVTKLYELLMMHIHSQVREYVFMVSTESHLEFQYLFASCDKPRRQLRKYITENMGAEEVQQWDDAVDESGFAEQIALMARSENIHDCASN